MAEDAKLHNLHLHDLHQPQGLLTMLAVLMCTDGGAAVVLTTLERARDLQHAPIVLKGYGEGHHYEHISQATDLTQSAAADSGKAAFEQAGIKPTDIDLAQLYDCFSPALLLSGNYRYCP